MFGPLTKAAQGQIFAEDVRHLKPGGTIVYHCCTLLTTIVTHFCCALFFDALEIRCAGEIKTMDAHYLKLGALETSVSMLLYSILDQTHYLQYLKQDTLSTKNCCVCLLLCAHFIHSLDFCAVADGICKCNCPKTNEPSQLWNPLCTVQFCEHFFNIFFNYHVSYCVHISFIV